MPDSDVTARLAAIELQLEELKAVQDLLLRLLSTMRPLSRMLEHYGATESKEQALYRFLDEMVEQVRGPQHRQPTFATFKVRVGGIFPELRDDRPFFQLLIDTLKMERPAYRELHTYMASHHWPVWD